MSRILLTGSRHWSDVEQLAVKLVDAIEWTGPGPRTLVHGGCRTGADKIADNLWRQWMVDDPRLTLPEVYPAKWRDGRSAGPVRNSWMVAQGADICLAFPIGLSRGTRDCLMKAQRAGIPTYVFEGR